MASNTEPTSGDELPDKDGTFEYMIVLKHDVAKDVCDELKEALEERHFIWHFEETVSDKPNYFLVTSTTTQMRKVAARKELPTLTSPDSVDYDKLSENAAKRTLFTASTRCLIVRLLLQRTRIHLHDAVESLCALHDEESKMAVWKSCLRSMFYVPLAPIRDYYGEQVAFYFSFMEFYTAFLIPTGVIGGLMWWMKPKGRTVDTSPIAPIFSAVVVVWAAFFLKFWTRRCSSQSVQWGTFDLAKLEVVRPEFEGEKRRNEVTGRMEKHYEAWRRIPKYFVSFLVSLAFLSIAFLFMCCSLNMQGYIHSKESFMYIEFLNGFAEPGGTFDPDSYVMFLVPTLMHSFVIMFLNLVYQKVAQRLTEWENYRTESEFEKHMIIKRFTFEFLDAFLPLFYIGFYQLDIVMLRNELMALYTSDEIRRIAIETLLPWAMHKVSLFQETRKTKQSGAQLDPYILESQLDEYEQFDDYLEMVLQFGYITLFASAFPIASFWSIVSNLIELRSDAYRLTFLSRRPHSIRERGIGAWNGVLNFMATFAILTNCVLFAFASEQMAVYFPQYFGDDAPDPSLTVGELRIDIVEGKGRWVMLIVFGIEHFLFVATKLVHYMISDQPKDVEVFLERQEYELEQKVFSSTQSFRGGMQRRSRGKSLGELTPSDKELTSG